MKPNGRALTHVLLGMGFWLASSCSSDDPPIDGGGGNCQSGERHDCAGPRNCQGVQSCEDATWGECVCASEGQAGGENNGAAGARGTDGGAPATDGGATSASGGVPSTNGGKPPGEGGSAAAAGSSAVAGTVGSGGEAGSGEAGGGAAGSPDPGDDCLGRPEQILDLLTNGYLLEASYTRFVGFDANGLPEYEELPLPDCEAFSFPGVCHSSVPRGSGAVTLVIQPPGHTFELNGAFPSECTFELEDAPTYTCRVPLRRDVTKFRLWWQAPEEAPVETCQGTYEECNGACTSIESSSSNCGACGSPCGGKCVNGRCLVTLATSPSVDRLAVDAARAYWLSGDAGTWTIFSVPLGGGPKTTIANLNYPPPAIRSDGDYVYWTKNTPNGGVFRVPVGGGTVTPVVTGQSYTDKVFVKDDALFWSNVGPTGQEGEVKSVPLAGGSELPLASALRGSGHALAVDAANVYWTNNSASGSVMQTARTGGPAITLASALTQPATIDVDDASVYFSQYSTTSGKISKVPIGGGPIVTLAMGQPGPVYLAVEGGRVYWVNVGNNLPDYTLRTVMSVERCGSVPQVLVPGQTSSKYAPREIVVDATSLYFTDGAGTVRKLTPK